MMKAYFGVLYDVAATLIDKKSIHNLILVVLIIVLQLYYVAAGSVLLWLKSNIRNIVFGMLLLILSDSLFAIVIVRYCLSCFDEYNNAITFGLIAVFLIDVYLIFALYHELKYLAKVVQ